MAALESVIEEYTSSLAELTLNSKPQISMLTILAEDYVDHAASIVEAVEAHLQKVQSDFKLPALYLIDSIIKTVSRPYLRLFSKNIVNTFCCVFEKVDEKTRANMWKLRQTWNEVFPIKRLFALDVRVRSIDPAWPIMPLPPGSLSEKTIKKLEEAALKHASTKSPPVTKPVVASEPATIKKPILKPELLKEAKMHEELLKKQKELIELQKQKIELELLQAKANLEQQRKQLGKQNQNLSPNLSAVTEEQTEKKDENSSPPQAFASEEKESSSETTEALKSEAEITDSKVIVGLHPRDPRIKTAVAATLEQNNDPPSAELSKQEQLIEHLKQQIQAKLATEMLLNDALKEATSYKPEAVNISEENVKKEVEKSERHHISTLALMSNSDYSSHRKKARSSKSRRHRKSKLDDDALSPDSKRSKRKRKRCLPESESLITTQSVSCLREEQIISMEDLRLNKLRPSPEKEKENEAVDNIGDDVLRPNECSADESKEDVDLRVLTVSSNKRKSETFDKSKAKKNKPDNYDPLFGDKDVDLRTSTSTLIFSNRGGLNKGTSWAKIKSTPNKIYTPTKPLTDQNSDRDRLGRPRLFKKLKSSPEELKNPRSSPIDSKQNERNIEIIMKQASEHLNQGTITRVQYNTIIQEVLHMCEHEKLRTAQIKEQEMEKMIWEQSTNLDLSNDKVAKNYSDKVSDKNISKNSSLQPRTPFQSDARWPDPWFGPWLPPPPMPPNFSDGFRPMGPWSNPTGPFSNPLRPDFTSSFRLCPRMNIPSSAIGPKGAMVGPMNTIGTLPTPGMILPNVTVRPEIPVNVASQKSADLIGGINANSTSNNISSTGTNSKDETDINYMGYQLNAELLKQLQLPVANKNLIAEIERDTMKSINIDGTPREIRYYGTIGVVFMSWNDPRDIGFQDGSRRVIIDDNKHSVLVNFNDDYKEFFYGGESHTIKLGTPTRELYVNDKWYECCFGGDSIVIELGNRKVNARLEGPIPQVKIGNKRTDLVIGKINLIINAKSILPIFLDGKPQIFEIEGQKCTLEFTHALQVVLLNGRPFNVEFGGLPKPIIVSGKKHYIRFTGLPYGFRPGLVKIKGMKGEIIKDSPMDEFLIPGMEKKSFSTLPEPPSVPPGLLDGDSNSDDCIEIIPGSNKSDSHLDVLSSVVSSGMAPSSGMSYQAEPMENPPSRTPPSTMPLNLGDLLQKLVDIGEARNQIESQKHDRKKINKITPVTFDKPETLKLKQQPIVSSLYNGMQCSSCGIRFLPEMAARYSHHLDWHFRQNRKERELAKKAHSRPWFHDLTDWIQFEEVEDLDDRVQSWFELEKQAERENEVEKNDDQPSIPTGSDKESSCEVCQEAFEQFYNEEKEEWHFRPTVKYQNKTYHPQCLKDYQNSLARSTEEIEKIVTEIDGDSKTEETDKNKSEKLVSNHEVLEIEDDEVIEISENEKAKEVADKEKTEKMDTDSVAETTKNSTKELSKSVKEVSKDAKSSEEKKNTKSKIMISNTKATAEKKNSKATEIKKEGENQNLKPIKNEQSKLEKPKEKIIEEKPETKKIENVKEADKVESMQDDDEDDDPIEIIEPIPRKIIVEDLIDSSDDDSENLEKTKKESSKMKNETKFVFKTEKKEEKIPDDVPLIFDNVKIKQEPVDEPEEKLAKAAGVDTTQVAVKSSIDGNVELESTARALSRTVSSKIKINITKSSVKVPPTLGQKITEAKKIPEKSKETSVPIRSMIPAAIKPSLQGKKMSILPTVEKDHELSGFCSVM